MILPYRDYIPKIGKGGWIAPSATVIGDVVLGEDVSIWFGTVIRGDVHRIRIGARTNIQDLSMLHITQHASAERLDSDGHPTLIGCDCTIGHKVILHGCTVEDLCLIGMGAILLDGAVIGRESIVGAGSVVTPGKQFPPRSLIMGTPAKVVRTLSEEQAHRLNDSCRHYVDLKNEYCQAQVGDCF